ncbi:MAG: bifunctional nicotinamidase/pyrazinamidase [Coriobacteriia bacterium]|nr:bifunctional nicotinamidase/pyrazinamidase [Coriobacteriia bacterium]
MDALLLVDIQNDFMPTGALPVSDGDAVVPVAHALMPSFELIVATQDWHPADHASFASNHPGTQPGDVVDLDGIDQVLWPDHCVQDSPGASFHSGMDIGPVGHVVRKGTDPRIDSYSAFFDNLHLKETGLVDFLREQGVSRVYLVGLATDYCVKFTALDGVQAGFEVVVVADGVRAVDLSPGDGERAIEEARSAGCTIVVSADVAARRRG